MSKRSIIATCQRESGSDMSHIGVNAQSHTIRGTIRAKHFVECQHITGRPRFGSVAVWEWKGSSGSGFRFWRFLCKRGLSVLQYSLAGRDGSGSGFSSWKTVPAVPVPLSVSV